MSEVKINKTMMQYFEWYLPPDCNLWKKVKEEARYLESIGISALWLPPAYKGNGGKKDVGYAVYDMYDLGEFLQKGSIGTKYGTVEEYIKAIQVLKGNGLKVYADVVLNHRIGADDTEEVLVYQTNSKDRTQESEDTLIIEAQTKFDFPERYNKYSDFKWNWTHFHGVDYDVKTGNREIYRFYGKHWDEDVDKENGNYDYLMGADVDFNNVDVVEEIKKWGKWYLDKTCVDGFRLDAVKHIRAGFFKEWLEELKRTENSSLFAVGEYWSTNLTSLKQFIEKTYGEISLFDVPLHYNFYNASCMGENYDLKTIFSNTLVDTNPELAVTFVDNHDTQPGQSLYSWIADWFKPLAYAMVLLRKEGYPCIFYGDYYGIPHDKIESKKDILEKMLYVRKKFVYGVQRDYLNDRNLIGWILEGDYEHKTSGMAVVLSNKHGIHTKKMKIGERFNKERFIDITGNVKTEVKIDENGIGLFKCKDATVSVWVRKTEWDY